MMNTTYELNNLRKDADYLNREMRATSIVSEVFSAMVNGKEVGAIKGADKAVNYIKELGARAENGDFNAVAELNTLRRFVIEAPLLQEMKMLSIFGSYQAVGFDETIEREVYKHVGEKSANRLLVAMLCSRQSLRMFILFLHSPFLVVMPLTIVG